MKYKGERAKAFLLIAVGLFLLAHLSVPAAATQEGGQINGVVTDDLTDGFTDRSAHFIAGADIRLYSFDRVLQTKADAKGHFRLSNVPDGIYELEVAASGFKTKTIELLKLRGGSSLSYAVALGIANPGCPPLDSISYEPNEAPGGNGLVEGVVVDAGPAGKPLAGVEVRLFHTSDKPISHKTNERGEFRFSVFTPGRYFIQIVRPGYYPAQSQQFWITREGRTVVTMRQLKVGWLIVCE